MNIIKPLWNSLVIRLLLTFCIILLPLILLHVISNYYAGNIIKDQVAQSYKNMLNVHVNQTDNALEGVSNYIYQLSENNNLVFMQSKIATNDNRYVETKLRLLYFASEKFRKMQ